LAAFVETFAAVVARGVAGAMGLRASVLLPSNAELTNAFLGGGVAGEEGSVARFAPVVLFDFLIGSFAEFIFKFKFKFM
jgi:hypothetical protein